MIYCLIKFNNEIYHKNLVNPSAFTVEEATELINSNNMIGAELIDIEKDIEPYRNECRIISEDRGVNLFYNWYNHYSDNNLNGFSLPRKAKDDVDYATQINSLLDDYIASFERSIAYKHDYQLINEVKVICKKIKEVLQKIKEGSKDDAKNLLVSVLNEFKNDRFWVSELDKSYAFRGVAPFEELHVSYATEEMYSNMLKQDITLFRARTKDKKSNVIISDLKHMVHLPYSMKENVSKMRFSDSKKPCLYFGTTSFVCCNELQWNKEKQDFYVAGFIPNEAGKKLKILNLAVSEAILNGIYNRGIDNDNLERAELQKSIVKFLPLVIATSFSTVSIENRDEYLLSQTLMEVLHDVGIDGVAYLSAQGKDEFQYPHGVNLAILADDITEEKEYSAYCEKFTMTKPICMNTCDLESDFGSKKSYINTIYEKYDKYKNENFTSKVWINNQYVSYQDTMFSKYDDYLVNQEFFDFE